MNLQLLRANDRISIAMFHDPKELLRCFGIRKKLVQEDWLHIKTFEWGELGYDYEEGLRIVCHAHNLPAATQWLKEKIRNCKIPLVNYRANGSKYMAFTANKNCWGPDIPEYTEVFQQAGWTKDEKECYTWFLK